MRILAASIKGKSEDIERIIKQINAGFEQFRRRAGFLEGFDPAEQKAITKTGFLSNTTAEIPDKMAFRMNISREKIGAGELLVTEIYHYGISEGADDYAETLKKMYETLGLRVDDYKPFIPYAVLEELAETDAKK